MDFEIVKKQIAKCYYMMKKEGRPLWSLIDYIEVFRYFYDCYRENMRCDHPPLRSEKIYEVMCALPIVSTSDSYDYYDCGMSVDVTPEDYNKMIPAYFKQEFAPGCNYSICHFVSGNIPALRWYETIYNE